MSSGKFHIKSGLVTWGVSSAISAHYFHPLGASLLSCGYLTGVLWLSPDVDGWRHIPCRLWGPLKYIWVPYQETHGHRSIHWQDMFSRWSYRGHWPLFGSVERLVYLALWLGILSGVVLVVPMNIIPQEIIQLAIRVNWDYVQGAIAVFWMGNEAASLFHIFCDYCPGVRYLGY